MEMDEDQEEEEDDVNEETGNKVEAEPLWIADEEQESEVVEQQSVFTFNNHIKCSVHMLQLVLKDAFESDFEMTDLKEKKSNLPDIVNELKRSLRNRFNYVLCSGNNAKDPLYIAATTLNPSLAHFVMDEDKKKLSDAIRAMRKSYRENVDESTTEATTKKPGFIASDPFGFGSIQVKVNLKVLLCQLQLQSPRFHDKYEQVPCQPTNNFLE
uniref:Uncharacterized protein n=1 Tax=Ditylenchus dipsaci TaxID=166011 RepID=A0A915DFN0_9BILA